MPTPAPIPSPGWHLNDWHAPSILHVDWNSNSLPVLAGRGAVNMIESALLSQSFAIWLVFVPVLVGLAVIQYVAYKFGIRFAGFGEIGANMDDVGDHPNMQAMYRLNYYTTDPGSVNEKGSGL